MSRILRTLALLTAVIGLGAESLPEGAVIRFGTLHCRPGVANARVALSLDGKLMATGEGDLVRLWDLTSGEELKVVPLTDSVAVRDMAFSADGATLFAVSDRTGMIT